MLEMLQQLQFAVSALGQDWRGERLHDLLDSHGLPGELVLRGAGLREQGYVKTRSTRHTKQDQRRPFLQAADRCICVAVSRWCLSHAIAAGCWLRASCCHEPAGDLERRAEDLGTYELCHGDGGVARKSVLR